MYRKKTNQKKKIDLQNCMIQLNDYAHDKTNFG